MKRLLRSFGFAWQGMRHCARFEKNFQIHLMCMLVALLAAAGLHISLTEWMVILLCIGLVLGFEMMNTALECICNRVMPEKNDAVKTIKDVAAGAVLVVATVAAAIGLLIFLPKIIIFIK